MTRKIFSALYQATLFWPSSEFSRRGSVWRCAPPITPSDKRLSVSEEVSVPDAAPPAARRIFHLLRCVIYIRFYGISCITHAVISPSFASGVTKHSEGSAAGIWSGFNFKRCETAPAVPTGCPGKADVLSLHTGLCFCDKLVLCVCSLSWSEQRKRLSLLLSSK